MKSPQPRSGRLPTVPPALRFPDFRAYWIGQLVSIFGTQFTGVAMAWQIYELTNSAVQIGLLGLARADNGKDWPVQQFQPANGGEHGWSIRQGRKGGRVVAIACDEESTARFGENLLLTGDFCIGNGRQGGARRAAAGTGCAVGEKPGRKTWRAG